MVDRTSSTFVRWCFAALCAAALIRVVLITPFMLDPGNKEHAASPYNRMVEYYPVLAERPFFAWHCCFSGYTIAAELAVDDKGSHIYDGPKPGSAPLPTPPWPKNTTDTVGAIKGRLGPDLYQYPPPFLLLPWVLWKLGGGFAGARFLFFLGTLAAVVGTAVATHRWLATPLPRSPLWAVPAIFLSNSGLGSLQIGNAHLMIWALAIAGTMALESRRINLGGALLGFATLTKGFPAVVLVYFLFRRRWHEVASTLGWMIGYCLLTLVLLGLEPFVVFFAEQLPALASGEAFWFAFVEPLSLLVNTSVRGLPYHLAAVGVPVDPSTWDQVLVHVYSLGLVLLLTVALWRARRSLLSRGTMLSLCIALMILAQARSPFLPGFYASVPVIALVVGIGLAAFRSPWRWTWTAVAVLGVLGGADLPLRFGSEELVLDHVVGMLATVASLGLAATVVVKSTRDDARERDATG